MLVGKEMNRIHNAIAESQLKSKSKLTAQKFRQNEYVVQLN